MAHPRRRSSMTNKGEVPYTFANTHSMIMDTGDGASILNTDSFYPKNGGEQPFTMELWIKTSAGSTNTVEIRLANGDGELSCRLLITGTNRVRWRVVSDNQANFFQKGDVLGLAETVWHHIVGVYKGDYTQGAASLVLYADGVEDGTNFTSGGTFEGIDDLVVGSKILIPGVPLSDPYKYNFFRFYNADMSANITTMYNGGVVPDLSGESFFGNIKSEMPFNNNLTALIGPDGTEVGTPTYDTDIPT